MNLLEMVITVNKKMFRVIYCTMVLILMLCSVPSYNPPMYVYAEENQPVLGTVTGLGWSEGSIATATWDSVDCANYYVVRVKVFYKEELLGVSETGTAATEIDLQHEIHLIVNNGEYSEVQVSYSVQPQIINERVHRGDFSNESDQITCAIAYAQKLDFPTNLTWNGDNLMATWNADVLSDMFYVQFKFNDGTNEFTSYPISIDSSFEGRNTANIAANLTSELRYMYKYEELTGKEVKVSYRIYSCLFVNNTMNYLPSDYSDWSKEILFKEDPPEKLVSPTNLTWNADSLMATWNADTLSDMFYVQFKFNDGTNEYTSYEISVDSSFEGRNTERITVDLTPELRYMYRYEKLIGKEVKVSYRVYSSLFINTILNYTASDYSDWSEEITFKEDAPEKLNQPLNLTWNEDNLVATWNADVLSDMFYVQFKFNDGTNEFTSYPISIDSSFEGRNTERITVDLTPELQYMYNENELDPIPVKVSYRIYSRLFMNNKLNYTDSEYSEWSEEIIYNPHQLKIVEAIRISPEKPVICLNNSYFLGKAIAPEDAYYKKIKWRTGDDQILSIDENGKIVANSVGVTTVMGQIFDAIDEVTVTVYDISTNIDDDVDKKEVLDKAGNIIDDIANNDVPNLDITDINQEDADNIRDEIHDAVEAGDTFHADIVAIQEYFGTYKENWEQIRKAADNENVQFAGAYNIEVEMYHKDNNGNEYHIGNITELENEISFTFDLPTGMKEEQLGDTKKYVLVRVHKNIDGETEYSKIDFTINSDGTFTAKSNKYSDFVWLSVIEEDCSIVGHNYLNESGNPVSECTRCGEWNDKTCDTNGKVQWFLDEDGTLYIYGEGDIENNPWEEDKERIERIEIFGEIDKICNDAFMGCSVLSVNMPYVTEIGSQAFRECYSLTSIEMPNVTMIGEDAFSACGSLISVKMPKVERIETSGFWLCESLTEIEMPNVIEVGDMAFWADRNKALMKVDMPKVEKIGSLAFYGCRVLTSVSMPNVVYIGSEAFQGDDRLIEIMVSCTKVDEIRSQAQKNEVLSKSLSYDIIKPTHICEEGECIICGKLECQITGDHDFGKYISNGINVHKVVCKSCGTVLEGHIAEACVAGRDGKCVKCEAGINGWQKFDNDWKFYIDGDLHTGWLRDGGSWYYLGADGVMKTGWIKDGTVWYYLESNGKMATNKWIQGTYYVKANGAMAVSEWVDSDKYYVDVNGRWVPNIQKVTAGWKQDKCGYWYQNADGSYPKNGWAKIDNAWYFFNASGYRQTGWIKYGSAWYYMNSSGVMQTGWQKINNEWYYFNGSGVMQAAKWVDTNYYIAANGVMVTYAYIKDGSRYYWVNKDGRYTKTYSEKDTRGYTVYDQFTGKKRS